METLDTQFNLDNSLRTELEQTDFHLLLFTEQTGVTDLAITQKDG